MENGQQLVPYNSDVEPRFRCLRVTNIPARREIRVFIFRALQPFTREFGPIVRFKMPGPYQTNRWSNAPPSNDEPIVLTAYVYFRSTAAPRFICSQHQSVTIHGFPLGLEVDLATRNLYNQGEEVSEHDVMFDFMAVPEQRQHILIPLDAAERSYYECPDCLSRLRLCNRMAHEQACRGRASEGARELAGYRQVLYRAISSSDNNAWMLVMARLGCPSCSRFFHEVSAQSVSVLKCGHSMCKDCVDKQKFSPPAMRRNPMILCKICFRVCRKAEVVDSLSLNTGRAGIQTIEAPKL